MKTNVCLKSIFLIVCLCACSMLWAQLPEVMYQPGKAVLAGEIKNYNPAQELNVRIRVPNLIMVNDDPVYIQPDSMGNFRQEIQLRHATQILFRAGNDTHFILMAPDNQEYYMTIEANEKAEKMPVRYSGPYAGINDDFNSRLRPFEVNVFNDIKTCEMTPDEYKSFCLNVLHEANAHNDTVSGVCPEARKLKQITNEFNCLQILNSCKYAMIYSRMQRDSLPRMVTFGLYKDFRLPEDYFDYLKDMPFNDPDALLSYEYSSVIPFANEYCLYSDEDEYIKYLLEHAPLQKEEKDLLNDYLEKKYLSDNYERGWDVFSLTTKYDSVFEPLRDCELQEFKTVRLPSLANWENTRIMQFIDLRSARMPFFRFKPLSPEQEDYFDQQLTDPLCIALLQEMNESMKPVRKKVADYVVCDNPAGLAGNVLDAIIEKNKGKIQFIDMWATWCSGCRRTIKEYEPLKKEFPGVSFVYITNETSPLDLWNKLIVDISGEHYRLNADQWNYIAKQFKLIGMPYYLIINDKGEIADQFIYTTKSEVQRKLSELHNLKTQD